MIAKPPYFSIIIPTLNEVEHLPLLLADLVNQTSKDFEVLVVDGHSVDQTGKIALSYQDKLSLHLIKTQTRNVSFQRNLGSGSTRSAYLLFMDADNRLPPDFLQKLKAKVAADQPEIFTTLTLPDSSYLSHRATASLINFYILFTQKRKNPFIIESLLGFSKKLFITLKGFNTTIPNSEGNELLQRALVLGYHHQLYAQPRYTYSLRRLSKEGLLKLTVNTFRLEIPRLMGKQLNKTTAAKLYPMKGGQYYTK